MPLPDRNGHQSPLAGKVDFAGAGLVALPLSQVRPPLGAGSVEEGHQTQGPAGAESLRPPDTKRMPQSIHAVHVGFFSDPRRREPAQLMEDWPSLVDIAEAAASAGARVSVLQASTHTQSVVRNDIRYDFFPFGRQALTLQGDRLRAPSAQSEALARSLRRLRPDVLHVHGLDFPRDVSALSEAAPGVPILLQDHASRPPRWWRRGRWRRGLAGVAGVSFCSADQAGARRATGLRGDPCVLWVGHLDGNKDPLTVLAGISEALRSLPELELWCCFG